MLIRLMLWISAVHLLTGCARQRDVTFQMHVLNAESRFEAAGTCDMNNDGRLDIISGGFWYEAPAWKKHFIRDIPEQDNYYYDFANIPVDVDGDGWIDHVTVAWHNKQISWVRHPGNSGRPFEVIKIDDPGHLETAFGFDVNDDGRLDIVPNIFDGEPGWYEFKPDSQMPYGVNWIKHPLPKDATGPGIGVGDINRDGRCDLIGGKGWAEQPANPHAEWVWHAEFDLGDASIPILVHDIDADGDLDLIWGIGHGYGLYWMEQERNAVGQRVWSKHEIDKSWSQAHAPILADIDNDGRMELIAGKRYYAHNGKDPGANDPRGIYWYDFDVTKRQWARHVIAEGGPAGLGIAPAATDIDGDGDIDIIAPGKSGLYFFENLLK
ncbi:MAG: FG-GAP repeat domain-containing protein [Phycisphaerae bacterium]